jgi:hypothetical protein
MPKESPETRCRRDLLAGIADSVAVTICLIRIKNSRTIIISVRETITIKVYRPSSFPNLVSSDLGYSSPGGTVSEISEGQETEDDTVTKD